MPSAPSDSGRVKVDAERLRQLRHDLRTPINQIIGYAEMLGEVAEDEGLAHMSGDLGHINTAARHLLAHIETCMEDLLQAPPASSVPGATDTPKPVASAVREEAGGEGVRILVVDDNELNRDMLSRRLARKGFVAETAEDGFDALHKLADRPFDAVVLDVMMPGMSGLDVLQSVRAEHDMTRLPVIMATARNASEDIVHALELGANDYVTKPIDFGVVLARLNTHLELRRITGQVRELAGELERGKQFIRSVFGRYLTDAVVDNLLDRPEGLELGGSSREVTVLMSDLRGFSGMSERLSPEEVVQVLNAYLGRMTEVIQAYGGTIDEFIGDAILVIFGAPDDDPDHAESAVACALAMQLAMDEVNAGNRARGLPEIEMGIGINTGAVVVGNIGSEKRSKYGVVGRNVNLAARIESYTVGGQILVSGETAARVTSPLRDNGSVEVSPKGCTGSLRIHSVCGLGGRHQLELPPTAIAVRDLADPAPVRFAVLDGVNVPRLEHQGVLVGVSEREAVIQVERADFPLLSSLAFEFESPGPGGKVFGKIARTESDGLRLVIRFPALPDEIARVVASWS